MLAWVDAYVWTIVERLNKPSRPANIIYIVRFISYHSGIYLHCHKNIKKNYIPLKGGKVGVLVLTLTISFYCPMQLYRSNCVF